MSKQYTKEQEQAITLQNCDLLVSAGAGSGKTMVMIDRVLNALYSGKSVLELLMLTFTNATASEMRSKLEDEIIKTLNETNLNSKLKNHLNRQLLLLGQADVCTIHGFCQKLIKKYFFAIDADPSFSIIDEAESAVLKQQALNEVFSWYLENKDEGFLSLAETYNQKRNLDELSKIVLKVYEFVTGQPDFNEYRQKILNLYNDDFDKSTFAKIINDYVVEKLNEYLKDFLNLKQQAILNGYDKIEQNCDIIIEYLSLIKAENSFSLNHKIVFSMPTFPSKPVVKDNAVWAEIAEDYARLKSDLKDEIDQLTSRIYISENLEEVIKNTNISKNNLITILDITEKFTQSYTNLKKEFNQLDFSDLEHFALKILEQPEIAEQIRQTYQEIFVDEYQDINNIQERIINSLLNNDNHLFLVGDVKQSIYRFRNTNPDIFVAKYNQYLSDNKGKKAIELNDNFRSFSFVLDFANYIFSKIMTPSVAQIDYKKTGMLKAGINFKNPDNALPNVEICVVNKFKQKEEKQVASKIYSVKETPWQEKEESMFAKTEGLIIAEKIARLMSEQKFIYDPKLDGGSFRELNFKDITLLVRSRGKYLNTIVQTLRSQGIPVSGVSGVGIFEEYEVQLLHNFLCLLANTQDDYILTSFLLSPAVNLTEQELANIRLKYDNEQFYICCQNERANIEKLDKAYTLIEQGRQELINGSISEVLNNFIVKTNLFSYILKMDNGKQRVLNMQTFIQHFLSHNYNYDLYAYLNYVDFASEIDIPVQNQGADNAVQVKTMHESKGLEFPVVFIVDASHQFNKTSLRGNCLLSSNLGIGLEVFDKENRVKNSTLVRSAILIEEAHQEFAEHLRLLYVAITRAKNHLFIVGKNDLENLKAIKNRFTLEKSNDYLSIILSALDDGTILKLNNNEENIVVNKGKNDEFTISVYQPVEEKIDANKQVFDSLVTNKQVDTIKLSKFMDIYCTNKYNYQRETEIALKSSVSKIMQQQEVVPAYMPEPKTFTLKENQFIDATEIGLAYHKAMQYIDYNLNSEEEIFKYLSKYMKIDELKLVECNKILKCIKQLKPLMQDAQILREQTFFMFVPYNQLVNCDIKDKILIQGVIDLLIVKNNQAILIDFKTNKENNAKKLWEKYQIQLDCYKKAAENSLNCSVTQKILYSFFNDCQISFDKQ